MLSILERVKTYSPNHQQLALSAFLITSFVALNFNYLPLLFYNPPFLCNGKECSVQQVCAQKLELENPYGFTSISMEYKLYCDDEKKAALASKMMFGHVLGAIICALLSKYGHDKAKVLIVYIVGNLTCAFGLIRAASAQDIQSVALGLTIWAAGCEIIHIFVFYTAMLFFGGPARSKIASLQTIGWGFYSIFLPSSFLLIPEWRNNIVYFAAVPHILMAISFIVSFSNLSRLEEQNEKTEKPNRSSVKSNVETTKASLLDLIQSKYQRNFIIYTLLYTGSFLAVMTTLTTLQTLDGNLLVNLTLINIGQFALAFVGGLIGQTYSPKKILRDIYVTLGVFYLAYNLVPSTAQFALVFCGKFLNDMTWVFLSIYLYSVVPKEYVPILTSVRCIMNQVTVSAFPYVKYLIEGVGISIFIYVGLLELCIGISTKLIKEVQKSD